MSYQPRIGEIVAGTGRTGKRYVGAFRQHIDIMPGWATLTVRQPGSIGGGPRVYVRTDSLTPLTGRLEGTIADEPVDCELCGEPEDDETGMFWDAIQKRTVVAHAQCGTDAGFNLA